MTSKGSAMIDLSLLALLDSGDLSELPLFDDACIGAAPTPDGVKERHTPGPAFTQMGPGFTDAEDPLGEAWMEENGLLQFLEFPDGEQPFLETIQQQPFTTDSSWQIFPADTIQETPLVPAATDEPSTQPYDSSVGHLFIRSPLSAEDVENFLSEPASPASPPSVSSQETQAPASPTSSEAPSLESPAPSSSKETTVSSELLELLISPEVIPSKLRKSRPAPYSRQARKAKIAVKEEIVEDIDMMHLSKKDKKKIQNKNAAIRYRQKKKLEADALKSEEDGLQDRHDELKEQVASLEQQSRYLRDLLKDVYKARGVKFDVECYLKKQLDAQ